MTPAIAEVLGMPNFVCGPFAHGFRMAGADIKRRSEDEQAFVLWRLLHLAILHGDKWREFATCRLQDRVRSRHGKPSCKRRDAMTTAMIIERLLGCVVILFAWSAQGRGLALVLAIIAGLLIRG